MAWKLGIPRSELSIMSLREFFACREAHDEYHNPEKREPEPMTLDRLRELGVEGA